MRQAVIIFTRIPIRGKTKTRLQKALTPEQCAKAHCSFLKDISKTCISDEWDTFIFYNPEGSLDILKGLLPMQKRFYPQKGNNLGDKMYSSILQILNYGYNSCVLIGADLPQITKENLHEAFKELKYSDVVLGKTFDGGYYLVGMKQAYKAVFETKDYGVKTVFQNTIKSIKNAGLSYSTICTQVDIDEPQDLKNLCKMIESESNSFCENTREFLKSIGWLKNM